MTKEEEVNWFQNDAPAWHSENGKWVRENNCETNIGNPGTNAITKTWPVHHPPTFISSFFFVFSSSSTSSFDCLVILLLALRVSPHHKSFQDFKTLPRSNEDPKRKRKRNPSKKTRHKMLQLSPLFSFVPSPSLSHKLHWKEDPMDVPTDRPTRRVKKPLLNPDQKQEQRQKKEKKKSSKLLENRGQDKELKLLNPERRQRATPKTKKTHSNARNKAGGGGGEENTQQQNPSTEIVHEIVPGETTTTTFEISKPFPGSRWGRGFWGPQNLWDLTFWLSTLQLYINRSRPNSMQDNLSRPNWGLIGNSRYVLSPMLCGYFRVDKEPPVLSFQ